MDLFLIKIGKAWNVLRRDGFFRGLKRVFSAFFLQFRRVHPGEVLFISNGVGDSARYRTRHVAEELNLHGFAASVTVQDNPFLISYADKFSVFVFHRVLFTDKIARFVEVLKGLGKTIVFETDDLVYDPEFLRHMDYYAKMNALEKKLYEHGVGGEILGDPYVTHCTTSTRFLKEKLEAKGKQVFLVRNKLSQEDVSWAEEVLRKRVPRNDGLVRICYLSGTPSHDKDFATITGALVRLLEKHPDIRLVLAGPLDTESALNRYEAQIERVAYMPRKEYFGTIAEMDINVAPLEIGNPFCESKSELKFFETGLVGVPTVAAATGTFREAIADGVDGFVAATEDEWVEKLEALIADSGRRRAMGEAARAAALRHYTTKDGSSPEYYGFLKERIGKA